MVHTVTLKDNVYQKLKAARFNLSDQEVVLTYSETIGKLIEIYEKSVKSTEDEK